MSLRLIELAFRHKILLTVPVIAGLALGVAWFWLSYEDQYTSRAAVWVDRPDFLPGGSFTEFNPYLSPAQNQADAMSELVGTNSFTGGILERVNATRGVILPQPMTQKDLRRGLSIHPNGNHVLFIEFASKDPMVAAAAVQAVVDQYTQTFTGQLQQNASRAREFYEEQLNIARTDLDDATAELNVYFSERPDLANVSIKDPPAAALQDPKFLSLQSRVQSANDNYDRILDRLTEIQLALGSNGESANYRVLDQAEVPTTPLTPGQRTVATKPLLGLVAGVFASAGLLALVWRWDRTVRLPGDLSFLRAPAPVMALPALQAKRRGWPKSFVRLASAISSGLTQIT